MSQVTTQLSKDEFTALLLIHGSHADLDFSEEEKAFVQDQTSKETYQKVNQLYDSLTDYEVLQLIVEHKEQYMSTSEEKQLLLEKLRNQSSADGDISKLEKILLKFLDYYI